MASARLVRWMDSLGGLVTSMGCASVRKAESTFLHDARLCSQAAYAKARMCWQVAMHSSAICFTAFIVQDNR